MQKSSNRKEIKLIYSFLLIAFTLLYQQVVRTPRLIPALFSTLHTFYTFITLVPLTLTMRERVFLWAKIANIRWRSDDVLTHLQVFVYVVSGGLAIVGRLHRGLRRLLAWQIGGNGQRSVSAAPHCRRPPPLLLLRVRSVGRPLAASRPAVDDHSSSPLIHASVRPKRVRHCTRVHVTPGTSWPVEIVNYKLKKPLKNN